MYVELDKIKKHLNIELAYTAEDDYLTHLYKVAENTVERHIDYPLNKYVKDDELTPTLQHAILLYIGDLYTSREGNVYGVSAAQVPFTYDYLLSLYKNYESNPNNIGR